MEKILIIEDDQQFASLMNFHLAKEGYEVSVVGELLDVESVKEQIIREEPDLILSDIMLQPNGFEILKVIKDDARLRMIPFIFISGLETLPNKIKAYLGGVENYLTKPVQKEELLAIITSTLKRHKQTSDAIYLDPLTGVHNRRFFQRELKRQIKLHQRHQEEFTLALLDLDHFKQINDTYGHTCGDRALIAFTNFIKSEIRSTDIFARWGGEEFFLIMVRSNLEGAMKTIQNVIQDIRSKPLFSFDDNDIFVSFSAGVAQYPLHGTVEKDLINVADQGVYRAKELGRGRVELFQEAQSPVS